MDLRGVGGGGDQAAETSAITKLNGRLCRVFAELLRNRDEACFPFKCFSQCSHVLKSTCLVICFSAIIVKLSHYYSIISLKRNNVWSAHLLSKLATAIGQFNIIRIWINDNHKFNSSWYFFHILGAPLSSEANSVVSDTCKARRPGVNVQTTS